MSITSKLLYWRWGHFWWSHCESLCSTILVRILLKDVHRKRGTILDALLGHHGQQHVVHQRVFVWSIWALYSQGTLFARQWLICSNILPPFICNPQEMSDVSVYNNASVYTNNGAIKIPLLLGKVHSSPYAQSIRKCVISVTWRCLRQWISNRHLGQVMRYLTWLSSEKKL